MDNVHGAHGTAGVVKHPLLVEVDVLRVLLLELADDEVDYGLRVLAVGRHAALRQLVQLAVVEDVEALEVALEKGHQRGQHQQRDGDDLEPRAAARGARGARRGARGGRGLGLGFVAHCGGGRWIGEGDGMAEGAWCRGWWKRAAVWGTGRDSGS